MRPLPSTRPDSPARRPRRSCPPSPVEAIDVTGRAGGPTTEPFGKNLRIPGWDPDLACGMSHCLQRLHASVIAFLPQQASLPSPCRRCHPVKPWWVCRGFQHGTPLITRTCAAGIVDMTAAAGSASAAVELDAGRTCCALTLSPDLASVSCAEHLLGKLVSTRPWMSPVVCAWPLVSQVHTATGMQRYSMHFMTSQISEGNQQLPVWTPRQALDTCGCMHALTLHSRIPEPDYSDGSRRCPMPSKAATLMASTLYYHASLARHREVGGGFHPSVT